MSDKPCSRENGFRVDCIKLYGDVMGENARLKAEVERLTNRNKGANMEAEEHCRRAMELRKAGDAMQDAVETYFELLPMLVNEVRAKAMLKGRKAIKEWNAAKEGKPSV